MQDKSLRQLHVLFAMISTCTVWLKIVGSEKNALQFGGEYVISSRKFFRLFFVAFFAHSSNLPWSGAGSQKKAEPSWTSRS